MRHCVRTREEVSMPRTDRLRPARGGEDVATVGLNPFKNRGLLKRGTVARATIVWVDPHTWRQEHDSTARFNIKMRLRIEAEGVEPYETEDPVDGSGPAARRRGTVDSGPHRSGGP